MGKKELLFKFFLCIGIFISSDALSQDVFEEENIAQVVQETAPNLKINYTWADFLVGDSCQEDFTALNELPFLTPEQEKLKNEMSTYCFAGVSVWDDLKTVFRQSKKSLLLNQAMTEEWFIMRYVRALPVYLFDIHHTTPKGDTLEDKLDKIQNVIENKKPEKVLVLMQDLSPNQQLFFMPLFNEVTQLLDFKRELREGEK